MIRDYIERIGYRNEDGMLIINGRWILDEQIDTIISASIFFAASISILFASTVLCLIIYGSFDERGALYANFGQNVCPGPSPRGSPVHPDLYMCVNWTKFIDLPAFPQILIILMFSSGICMIINFVRGMIQVISINLQQE